MSAKTTLGRLAFWGGGRQDQPGTILVDERASQAGRGRSRGNLYIVLEIAGPASGRDLIARQLTEIMRRAYYGWKGSVTAGLQQAIREANELLLEENRNSLPGERRMAGVSCVVLRDDDLYIAQAGPAAVYMLSQGKITRFPEESPWLDGLPPEEMDAAALGERREVRVDLFHSPVSEGDTILLADSELARWIIPDLWPEILARIPLEAVLRELLARVEGLDLTALVLRFGQDGVQRLQIAPGLQPDLDIPYEEALPVQEPVTVTATAVGAPITAREAEPVGEPLGARVAQWRLLERVKVFVSAVAVLLARMWAGVLSFLRRMVPGQVDQRVAPARPTTTVSTVGAKPVKRPRARRPADVKKDPVQRLLVGVAIAIPAIVAVIVLVAWIQRGQAQRLELEGLWQQATTSWQQAQANTTIPRPVSRAPTRPPRGDRA
jgi:hypothetical protein